MKNKKRISLLLAMILLLCLALPAYGDPSYSEDGATCTGEGCHGAASGEESPAQAPQEAQVVEDPTAKPAPEAAGEPEAFAEASERMAQIVSEALFSAGEEAPPRSQEEQSFIERFTELITQLFESFLSLLDLLLAQIPA